MALVLLGATLMTRMQHAPQQTCDKLQEEQIFQDGIQDAGHECSG